MITINCTNCKALLEIDEAFAGGVCRCQHCGTIQTVPAHLRQNAPAGGPSPMPVKPVYQAARHGGTGLDELSDAVMSSGLARGALSARAPVLEAPTVDYARPQQQKKSPVLWIVLGGVAAVLLVLLGWLFTSSTGPTPNVTIRPAPGVAPVVPSTPHFLGIDLTRATGVVYILDRGSASEELLDMVKASTYRSVESLGGGKSFAILFWENAYEPVIAYPETGLAPATPEKRLEAEKLFEDVVAAGRSDPASALTAAAGRGASDIVIVTRKADDLAEDFPTLIEQSFPGARVHTIALVEDYGSSFPAIASKTGGSYQVISESQLRAFSR